MAVSEAVRLLKLKLLKRGVGQLSIRRQRAAKGFDAVHISRRDSSYFSQWEINVINSVMGRYAQSFLKAGQCREITFYTIEVEMALGLEEQKCVCSCGRACESKEEEDACGRSH